MILYDNRDAKLLLLSRAGSVIFTPNVLVPASISTILCALIVMAPDMKIHMIISGSVVRIYATILGFVIVFRTNMAFNRYFDGVLHLKAMFSKWRDAFTQLCVFMETSSRVFESQGKIVFVRELSESKARIVHWFSLLTALVTLKLKGVEGFREGLSTKEIPQNRISDFIPVAPIFARGASSRRTRQTAIESQNSMKSSASKKQSVFKRIQRTATIEGMQLRPPFTCCEDLREHAYKTYGSNALVLGAITPSEVRQLDAAEDDVLCVMRWIKLSVSEHSIAGRLLIGPPILSRVYQELSSGMSHFFMCMKVVFVPFPFPFAQFLQYALVAFILFCPFAILPTLDDPPQTMKEMWPALLMNFMTCVGYMALNEIAVELEDPFGEDANDYPLHQEQWNIIWAIEDCFYTVTPREFVAAELGQEALAHAANTEKAIKTKLAKKLKKEQQQQQQQQHKHATPPPAPPPAGAAKAASAETPAAAKAAKSPEVSPDAPEDDAGPVNKEIEALVPSFQALKGLVAQSVSALHSLGDRRRSEVDAMTTRLQELLPATTANELPIEAHPRESQVEGRQNDKLVNLPWLKGCWEAPAEPVPGQPARSSGSVEQASSPDPEHGSEMKRSISNTESDDEAELQQLVAEHSSLTRRLRAVLKSAREARERQNSDTALRAVDHRAAVDSAHLADFAAPSGHEKQKVHKV